MRDIRVLIILMSVLAAVCFSQLYALQADVEGSIVPRTIPAGGQGELVVTFVYPDGMKQILQEDYFFIEIEDKQGFSLGELSYPPPDEVDEFGFTHYYDQTTLRRDLYVDARVAPGEYKLTVVAGYQLCYLTGACIMPEEVDFEVNFIVTEGTGEATGGGSNQIYLFLLFALLGGVILNFTPCVLPVLSLRAFALIRDSQSDRKKITISSLVYCLGIIVCFLILALIIIILKASGEMIGWGFQFQNPVFVLVLTTVIFVFSLSLFDVFVITAPDTKVASKMTSKRGLAGSFFMGVFAVILGTPCTAPVLGAALAFAFAQPPLLILAMFLLIGIGMSIPFLLIAIRPQFVNKLPKPGEWMNLLKGAMGFLLLLWAVKMMEVLFYQLGGRGVIAILYFFLAVAFGVWIIGRYTGADKSTWKRILAAIIGLVTIIVVGNHTLQFSRFQEDMESEAGMLTGRWQAFSPEKIAEYREAGIPVFIDFTAKWCTTCYANEVAVLKTQDIQAAFEEAGVELFIADFTSFDETIAEWIQSYGRIGVPVYVFYLPGEEEPILLPEIITKRMVLDVLARID